MHENIKNKIRISKTIFMLFIYNAPLMSSQDNYIQGIKYFEEGKYYKAYSIIKEEAKNNNHAAQYRLGVMYNQGLGTKVDYKKSTYWFKESAHSYTYIDKNKKPDINNDFLDNIQDQIEHNDKIKQGREYLFSKMDTKTSETKTFFGRILEGDNFGILPYRTNYFMPLSYSKNKPSRVYATKVNNDAPTQYNKNIEVEFQLSLQKELTYNLFGLNEYTYAAYTQKVWWQLYDKSGPFRETNYEPEIFTIFPTSKKIDDALGLKAIKLGFVHESNGREGYQSRSWNRTYIAGMWEWDNLFLTTRIWYRLKETRKTDDFYARTIEDPTLIVAQSTGDDNPDILDFLGYGDIKLQYLSGKSKFGILLRNNLKTSGNKGAIEVTYAHSAFKSPNSFFYIKVFNGYGRSLAEYNENVTNISLGVSFSSEIF